MYEYVTTKRPSAAAHVAQLGHRVELLPKQPGRHISLWRVPIQAEAALRQYEGTLAAMLDEAQAQQQERVR